MVIGYIPTVSRPSIPIDVPAGMKPATYRVSEAAGRTITVWDYANSREQLIYGDTGTRNVTTLLTNVTSGSAYISRNGNMVTFDLAQVAPSSTLASGGTFLVLPSGFRPTIRRDMPVFANSGGTIARAMFMFANGGVGVWSPATTDSYRHSMTFPTADPWPTTLPGVSA